MIKYPKDFKNAGLLILCLMLMSFNSNAQSRAVRPIFNRVFLSVSNIYSSLNFYTKAFELEVSQRLNQLKITEDNQTDTIDVKLVFLKFPQQDFVLELAESGEVPTTSGLFQHLGVEVDNINTVFKKLVKYGAEWFVPIRHIKSDGSLEIKQAFFKEPDNEQIEIIKVLNGTY